MAAVLPTAGKKLIFDERAKGILPLFPLGGAGSAPEAQPTVKQ
jgi:hypothetical protein